jgi:hypothetical protein
VLGQGSSQERPAATQLRVGIVLIGGESDGTHIGEVGSEGSSSDLNDGVSGGIGAGKRGGGSARNKIVG